MKADRSYIDESYLTDEKILRSFQRPNVKYVYQMPQGRTNKRNLRYTPMDARDEDELTPKMEQFEEDDF